MLVECSEEKEIEAFEWALKSQRAMGWSSEPIQLDFSKGDYFNDDENCNVCLFSKGDETILLRIWEREMCVKFNRVTNINEVAKTAPKSYHRMMYNGLALYAQRGKTIGI